MAALKVVTANVNGVRAALRRGGLGWLESVGADLICLQEVRATHEQLHEVIAEADLRHWHVAHSPAPQLGRAGVAILSREQPTAIRDSVGLPALDRSGRWIEVDLASSFGPLTVVSAYVHSGEADTPKQVEKYAFLAGMDQRLELLSATAEQANGHVIVCGDFNIAHHEVDIKNWKGNLKSAGFLPQERAYLDRWFARDWVDLGRAFGGEGPGPYTWWSWRGKAFDNDAGWRIDYVICTPALASLAREVVIGRAPSYAERWSDHAPVGVRFAND